MRLTLNESVKTLDKHQKVFCQEAYAQEQYDRMMDMPVVQKDVTEGQSLRVDDMDVHSDGQAFVHTAIGVPISIDLRKDKKFFSTVGFKEEALEVESFIQLSEAKWFKDFFENHEYNVIVENSRDGGVKGSLYESFLASIRQEFFKQITEKTHYYTAKIVGKNQGGFFVRVSGIDAFLPGSLAAANKIVDFETYIGKEIDVMVEDYLPQSDTFIFSFKRYLEQVLPSKLAELKRNSKVVGIVTGCSKFGVFLELKGMFTGLLHTSEMTGETLVDFNNGAIKPSDEMEVWIKDIKDKKLILTENDLGAYVKLNEELKERLEGKIINSKVVSVKQFGVFFEVEEGRIGLLPLREMKKIARKMEVGEEHDLFILRVDADTAKIYLSAVNQNMVYTSKD